MASSLYLSSKGSVMFRLLSVLSDDEETIVGLFTTYFTVDFPYDPQELVAFALIGVFCGLGTLLAIE